MTSYRKTDGGLAIALIELSDTSATTIVSGDKGGVLVDEVQVSNPTASAVTVVVDVYDGTTAFKFETGKSIPANSEALLDHNAIPLNDGKSLRVTGASGIQVSCTYMRAIYQTPQGQSAPAQLTVPGRPR